ncbi:hypothetical protein MMC26_006653 [Xylographa opegraphella]|nr:hypothetical protein [Xylographa opegraphella]
MAVVGGNRVAVETIELLESRLQRLAFYTSGTIELESQDVNQSPDAKAESIQTRLQLAEDRLQRLASNSQVVEEILSLYHKHANMFSGTPETAEQASFSDSERLSIVKSCATLFPTTASRLTSIQDLPIPSAESSTNLVILHPRVAEVEVLQDSQAQEIANLRLRTVSVLQRWYEVGILAYGECWTEWDERLMEVEKTLTREEGSRAREATAI